ncbi:negative transcriptional regulator, PaiB family [Promicromonospora umidemergens]|uniref:FMN-binding negative transcriptional regulator n=1 Tax=Promicromonospora umidemergens TaxID=629679 RepID=A0ABP8YAQ3_9MICO|nr:FMN-binding negative transcriptional regulator [Promicromonospora umidemergens]MCP2284666.1 negative transcriptional regulator, PaiB family [Promicromonospora umidemergens]
MIDTGDYEIEDEARVRDLVRNHGWATLVSVADDGAPVASHLPVLLEDTPQGEPMSLLSHVGRPDEVLHRLDSGRESLLIVQGPHGYVSPGWYDLTPAVPTWNYLAVHLHCAVELLAPAESYRVLSDTVDRYESVMPRPVRLPHVEEYARRIAKGAAGFRLRVTRWQGKAKLSQDKPRAVAERVIAALEADPHYAQPALAAEMRAELGRRVDGLGGGPAGSAGSPGVASGGSSGGEA